jgi:hypothetical protein
MKWGFEFAQRDKSVSTCAFSLNRHDILCSTLVKEAVLMVPTLGQKSTNLQSVEFHYHVGQQCNSGLLFWRQHTMLLQAVTSFIV